MDTRIQFWEGSTFVIDKGLNWKMLDTFSIDLGPILGHQTDYFTEKEGGGLGGWREFKNANIINEQPLTSNFVKNNPSWG